MKTRTFAGALLAVLAVAVPAGATTLRVMKQGLGTATITSTPAAINCPPACVVSTYAGTETVVLNLSTTTGFRGWSGDCTGTGPCSVPMNTDRAVRAWFDPVPALPRLTMADLLPDPMTGRLQRLADFLVANPRVDTASEFLYALPDEFKWNWILMSRSESLQTGTADTPRILLPSANGQLVFTFGMRAHTSYPGAHPSAIEYMQWDPGRKDFRFHEISLENLPTTTPPRTRRIYEDDARCTRCHSTRNILNPTTAAGTTGGGTKAKSKPNWDTYDSWGGMLPLNRDRIYQGSIEETAFKKIFNLWTWIGNDLVRSFIEQLTLQPPVETTDVITRASGGAADGEISIAFRSAPTATTTDVTYSFDRVAGTPGTGSDVTRGGNLITLHHSTIPGSDEGRGVHFFDLLGSFTSSPNEIRIADEVNEHGYATGSVPIDVRPVALAIAKDCLTADLTAAGGPRVTAPALVDRTAFFDARNGMDIGELITDTRLRAKSLPRRKADIQRWNLDRTNDIYMRPSPPAPEPKKGLIHEYDGTTTVGTTIGFERLRNEVFRRPNDFPSPDDEVMGGVYVDREEHAYNNGRMALFRYFLEPLGVSVDKWSMGVRGRSRTYTFADVFDSGYIPGLRALFEQSLRDRPVDGFPLTAYECTDLIPAVNHTFRSLTAAEADRMPTYTDIQRIFNKACIECHGGLGYPPFDVFYRAEHLDVAEDDSSTTDRLRRSYDEITYMNAFTADSTDPNDSYLYQRITATSEDCGGSAALTMMPCGGPALSKADVETIRRWLVGPPRRPYSMGDPHIATVDGTNYDFQSAGEFVLLRGTGVEIQTRQTAIETEAPLGPDGHTGLTSCVSLNTAAAFRIGPHRVTYQADGRNGLQLRVDGKAVDMGERGLVLPSSGRIVPTGVPGGIQIELTGGGRIAITPGQWGNLWFLNIDLERVRATEGVAGAIAPENWLPALPDGTLLGPLPDNLQQRYQDLYERFANAWRVDDRSSLFDYAPGTSTRSFSFPDWPGQSPATCRPAPQPPGGAIPPAGQPLPRDVAARHCAEVAAANLKENCIADVMVTGEPAFAKTYLLTEQVRRNARPAKPALLYPESGQMNVPTTVTFTWNRTSDGDGDRVRYLVCVWEAGQPFTFSNCTTLPASVGPLSGPYPCALLLLLLLLFLILLLLAFRMKRYRLFWLVLAIAVAIAAVFLFQRDRNASLSHEVTGLKPGQVYFWKVIAEDGKGGTTETPLRRFATRP